jgi:PIN domain nuclease of toxin-antitoxin system
LGEEALKLLLDTHVLISWFENKPISPQARLAISEPDNDVLVSVASVWESAIERASGKLDVPDDMAEQVVRHEFGFLPIHVEHAIAAGALPLIHRDPFDRMLIGQALHEGLTVVTRDRRLQQYGVPVLSA